MKRTPPPFDRSQITSLLWQDTFTHQGEAVLSVSLRIPAVPGDAPASVRRIGRFYRRAAAVTRRRWEQVLFPRARAALDAARAASRPFRPWSATGDFSVTFCRGGLLSLRLELSEQVPGSRPLTVLHTDVWDLASGVPRTLASFFPARAKVRAALLEQAARDIRRRTESGECLYYEDWPLRLRKEFSPERFYLTQQGQLAFFYPLYTLAPYAEGIPTFTLPCPIPLPAEDPAPAAPSPA